MKYLKLKVIAIMIFIPLIVGANSSTSINNLKEVSQKEKDRWRELSTDLEIAYYHKDFKKALKISSEIYRIDKTQGELIFADTYHYMGKYEKAIEWSEIFIESAKKENLSLETALMIIANSYYLMGDSKQAVSGIEKLIKLYPKSPMGYKLYAQYYEKQNDIKNAISYWEEAQKRFQFDDWRAIKQAKERLQELRAKLKNEIVVDKLSNV